MTREIPRCSFQNIDMCHNSISSPGLGLEFLSFNLEDIILIHRYLLFPRRGINGWLLMLVLHWVPRDIWSLFMDVDVLHLYRGPTSEGNISGIGGTLITWFDHSRTIHPRECCFISCKWCITSILLVFYTLYIYLDLGSHKALIITFSFLIVVFRNYLFCYNYWN